jgi:hypothetical protein
MMHNQQKPTQSKPFLIRVLFAKTLFLAQISFFP